MNGGKEFLSYTLSVKGPLMKEGVIKVKSNMMNGKAAGPSDNVLCTLRGTGKHIISPNIILPNKVIFAYL